jgi:hypothetical protein
MVGTPDWSPDVTWMAIGKALTAWEEMEEGFGRIYCAFKGTSNMGMLKKYADEANIFKDRMDLIERSAEAYFTRKPDQNLEGEIAKMVKRARLMSKTRHRIAHGVVYPMVMNDRLPLRGTSFALHPTWYALERLSKPDNFYVWGSKEIAKETDKFIVLSRWTRDYAARLLALP